MTPAVAASGLGRAINPRTRQAMFSMVQLLTGNKNAEIFQKPVTKKDAPDYAQAVLRPTDLSTIQKAIKSGAIATWEELERDLTRMLANSCVYNKPGTQAYDSARLVRVFLFISVELLAEICLLCLHRCLKKWRRILKRESLRHKFSIYYRRKRRCTVG
jgi:hypothetical protein